LAGEQQAKLLSLKTYEPALSAATAGVDAETQKLLVKSPDNIKNMVILDEQEANKYSREYEKRWNRLMFG
jgi:putative spermidine/putrescine transport system substrate-binding protein